MKHRVLRLMEYIGEVEDIAKCVRQNAVPMQGERDFGLLFIRSCIMGTFPEPIEPGIMSPYDMGRQYNFSPMQKEALRMAIEAVAEMGPAGLGAQLMLTEMFGKELERD